MFFKVFALCLYMFCFDSFALTKESGLFKEDLTELYAVAFSNNWRTVSSKMEMIVDDYEKHPNIEKTLSDLDSLKDFVLANKLNPKKTKAFLVAYEATRKRAKVTLSAERNLSHPVQMIRNISKNVPAINIQKESQFNQKRLPVLLGGVILLILFSFYLRRKKKELQREAGGEQKLDLEEKLGRESDLVYWEQVKPEIYRLIFGSKVLLKESVEVYLLEDLFSMEFYFSQTPFLADDLQKLKRIMSVNKGELLLVTDYKNEEIFPSSKLVMNFYLNSESRI